MLYLHVDAEAEEFEDGNCEVKTLDSSDEFALPFKKDPKVGQSILIL